MTRHSETRAADILAFMRRFQAAEGRPPTIQEIATAASLSKTGAYFHVRALTRAGLVRQTTGYHGGYVAGAWGGDGPLGRLHDQLTAAAEAATAAGEDVLAAQLAVAAGLVSLRIAQSSDAK